MQFRIAAYVMLVPVAAFGCVSTGTFATGQEGLRPAVDPPERFVTEDGTHAAPGTCRSPLIDPRDQTRLRLVRSGRIDSNEQGDYDVSAGQYGVRSGELLRIDCGSGRAIGIVGR
jgi:hypothetical protein